jgi:RNA 3'-terminal phosphate cyclase (ATP)
MIELDGSAGEGGGQMLRTALSLSMVTQTPFRIRNIRAGRAKPGLLRQHLTAVQAAGEISGAEVEGASLGSQDLSFRPGPIRGGDYSYAIGTAGSCTLVLQTLVPALWFADRPAQVRVSGGTHNPAAPPMDFLQLAWLPLVTRMGAITQLELLRHGFYPAGGGAVLAKVEPSKLRSLILEKRGELRETNACALVAGVALQVAERELRCVTQAFEGVSTEIRELPQREGPGNAMTLTLEHEHATEVFCGFGERGRPAEAVAAAVVRAARAYISSCAAVAEHLADQLVLPIALAGAGRFTTMKPSGHLLTNIAVIEQFLPMRFCVEQVSAEAAMWVIDAKGV